ncbi:MAG: hypothetical protein JST16_07435 [Bdellovibrionales bacterium]|nr:hypothetical protein [Bdellovibrionales bacterium]
MKARRTRSGQTIIEFVFVSVLFVFMLVLTFNAILAFTVHQYMSYAVFMAARAYQASADSPQTQVANAKATLAQYIPDLTANQIAPQMSHKVFFPQFTKRKALANITAVRIVPPQEDLVGFRGPSGITVEFEVPFAELPLGSAVGKEMARISLTAKSALGREVTVQECKGFFQRRFSAIIEPIRSAGAPGLKSSSGGPNDLWHSMEDNGC